MRKKLAESTAQWANLKNGALLHIRGAEGEGRLAQILSAQGFEIREIILYDVAPELLSSQAIDALQKGQLDAALFFSPRSARIFKDSVAGLDVSALLAICISRLLPTRWRRLSFVPFAWRRRPINPLCLPASTELLLYKFHP